LFIGLRLESGGIPHSKASKPHTPEKSEKTFRELRSEPIFFHMNSPEENPPPQENPAWLAFRFTVRVVVCAIEHFCIADRKSRQCNSKTPGDVQMTRTCSPGLKPAISANARQGESLVL
jgi:hypothetical protein